ncbi:MAG TPA: nucleotidyltransferase [Candidatus Angelobacter sp.]|jgi:hypothetical protein|nr:nucleotidyltransferase [Candidatus Angelobacter sp.]
MSFVEVLRRVAARMEQSEVPYMVTGSIAASYYGLVRATQDLDIVISAGADGVKRLMNLFPEEEYYAPLQDALDALRHNSMFNVLDMTSSWKIDFIFSKPAPFHREAFERRRAVTFEGVPTFMISPEDLIVAKLEWARMSESERQIRDVGTVAQKRSHELDKAYVEKWVAQLGLGDQWGAARKAAGI